MEILALPSIGFLMENFWSNLWKGQRFPTRAGRRVGGLFIICLGLDYITIEQGLKKKYQIILGHISAFVDVKLDHLLGIGQPERGLIL